MAGRSRSGFHGFLHPLDVHLPALAAHRDGLANRLKEQEPVINQADDASLDRVHALAPELLLQNAYPDAERLQNRAARMKTPKEHQDYLTDLHVFLSKVVSTAEKKRDQFLDVLKTGKRLPALNRPHGRRLYDAAMKRRKRLGSLMHRYYASGLWTKNQIPGQEARALWREMVRDKMVGSKAAAAEMRLFLSQNERRGGLDPNTFLKLLAVKAGVHPLEFKIANSWKYPELEKITGKKILSFGVR